MTLLQVKNEWGEWLTLNRNRDQAELRIWQDQWRFNDPRFATAVMRIVREEQVEQEAWQELVRRLAPSVREEMGLAV